MADTRQSTFFNNGRQKGIQNFPLMQFAVYMLMFVILRLLRHDYCLWHKAGKQNMGKEWIGKEQIGCLWIMKVPHIEYWSWVVEGATSRIQKKFKEVFFWFFSPQPDSVLGKMRSFHSYIIPPGS